MKYKLFVDEIKNLPWHTYDPRMIICASHITAVEFAQSLRYALEIWKEPELALMAKGELKTDNLAYGDYNKTGDHHEFLAHFMAHDEQMTDIQNVLHDAKKYYLGIISKLTKQERAMTVFSREQELPGIFASILKSHDWDSLGLGYYKYYLERHIELDETEGGHGDLTKDFFLNEHSLEKFYKARLGLYKSLE